MTGYLVDWNLTVGEWFWWAVVQVAVSRKFVGIDSGNEAFGKLMLYSVFFFQAEDGIRDVAVTGVQTCALPICSPSSAAISPIPANPPDATPAMATAPAEPDARNARRDTSPISPSHWLSCAVFAKIGRASCRERV